jgi:hypothetical protein
MSIARWAAFNRSAGWGVGVGVGVGLGVGVGVAVGVGVCEGVTLGMAGDWGGDDGPIPAHPTIRSAIKQISELLYFFIGVLGLCGKTPRLSIAGVVDRWVASGIRSKLVDLIALYAA